jgi:DNA polymerase I-like protein with 3'-5' exonuclease and polymerase domains
MEDLETAIRQTSVAFPKYVQPQIDVLTDLTPLTTITNRFALDYETTGIKPHAMGHRIVCAAVADTVDHAYVFRIPESRVERRPLTDALENPSVEKIAHNMKFENAWTEVRLRCTVGRWGWDTMLAAHVMDNRRSVTGLKFLTYVHLGVADYSSDIEPYLKPKGKANSNSFNQIDKLLALPDGAQRLMQYCALDAVHTLRLAELQRNNILPF